MKDFYKRKPFADTIVGRIAKEQQIERVRGNPILKHTLEKELEELKKSDKDKDAD